MAVPPVRRHNHDQHEAGKSPIRLAYTLITLSLVSALQRTPSPCLLEQVWRHVLHTHIAWLNKDCTFTLVTTRPAEPLCNFVYLTCSLSVLLVCLSTSHDPHAHASGRTRWPE